MKYIPLIILIAVIAYFTVTYFQKLYAPPASGCPDGSTYVRSVTGGGWVQTDATDPFGKCVANAQINAAMNQ